MKYKIQSRTVLGWMDIIGDFDTIQDAQKKIPLIQKKLYVMYDSNYQVTSILRIVDTKEESINDQYVY
jgi:hypothetical protein